ncbi:MAG: hypothetical protein HQL73_05810 [Magnetococcales bacterium]|nr:hypothetical protein [Magnetococcales bacterium]
MDVTAVVERLVQERGQLDPIVFLQEMGFVSKPGLAAWRQGQVDCLQEVLQGDPQRIDACLRQAARMARTLGLAPKTVDACRTHLDGQRQGLRVDTAGDPGREALYTTHYQRPKDHHGGVQMDLFLDTPETLLVNDLIQAIARHDLMTATELCQRLRSENPENGILEDLPPLIAAIELGDELPQQPLQALERLHNEILPCSRQALGALAKPFLKPIYRRLDRAFVGFPFDPAHPDAHRSWTLERLENWRAMAECILLEENWTRQPVLLYRRAQALFRLKRLGACWQVWATFFWAFPPLAPTFLEKCQDRDLLRLWHGFIDLDLEVRVTPELFPVWMALAQPQWWSDNDEWPEDQDDLPGQTVFLLLVELLRAENDPPSTSDSLSLRRKLKETSPAAFELFMKVKQRKEIIK